MTEEADDNVHHIAPARRTIDAPAELRQLQAWLCWNYEHHTGETKPRKVPRYAGGGVRFGKHGSPKDRANLVTFAAARDAAARRGYDGVGFALMPEWGITALDFDNCVDADGNLPPEIVDVAARTFSEYSPSGKGIRAFVKGNYGDRKSLGNSDWNMELFQTKGFVTVTGHVLPLTEMLGCENTIADIDDILTPLVERRFAGRLPAYDADDFMAGLEKPLGLTPEEIERYLDVLDADMGRDGWIRVGMACHHETGGDIDGFQIWDAWSAGGGKYPGEEALQAQWESFTRRAGPGQRQVTMASVIKMAGEAIQQPSAQELEAVVQEHKPSAPLAAVATPTGFDGAFPIYSAADLASRPPGEWLIKNVIPHADIGVIYGAPGSGKTFCGIDLLACIARGQPWRGQRVRKGRALIISAEGGAGMGKRLEAYCLWHNIDITSLDIGVITVPPSLMDKESVIELVKAITAAGGVSIIMVDTLAQVTPGANENAADDMGLALANARAIRNATGAFILLVAHSGKDASRGIRGWSGFTGASDVILETVRYDNGSRELRIGKMKDGDDDLRWGFKLEIMQTGIDSDGDAITSCVAVEADAPVVEDKAKKSGVIKYGKWMNHIMEVIELHYPEAETVPYYELVGKAVEVLGDPGDLHKARNYKRDVARAIKALCKGDESPLEVLNGKVIIYSSGG